MSKAVALLWAAILVPIVFVFLAFTTERYLGLGLLARFWMNLLAWTPPLFNICLLLSSVLLLLSREGDEGVKRNWRKLAGATIALLIVLVLVRFFWFETWILQYITAWVLGNYMLPPLWKALNAYRTPIPHDEPLWETPSLAYEQGYREQTRASAFDESSSTEPANAQPALAPALDYEQPQAHYPRHPLPMIPEEEQNSFS